MIWYVGDLCPVFYNLQIISRSLRQGFILKIEWILMGAYIRVLVSNTTYIYIYMSSFQYYFS